MSSRCFFALAALSVSSSAAWTSSHSFNYSALSLREVGARNTEVISPINRIRLILQAKHSTLGVEDMARKRR